MAAVVKKNKAKALKKSTPAKKNSKFISQALVNRSKAKKNKRKHPKTRGMVFIKNLPHGFFEEQLRGYFSQFGAITRLRLGRSPKTLNSKGYVFIEFRYPEVAEIAAQTMNNYIMFHRIIKTKYIPPNEIRNDYFKCNISKVMKNGEKVFVSKKILAKETLVANANRLKTDADEKKRIGVIRKRLHEKKQKLAELGIEFDIDDVAKEMGEEVIKESSTKPLTISNLKEDDLDDDADETFNPGLEIESDDEVEDFEYDSDESEIIEKEKTKEIAIEKAKQVRQQKLNESKKGKGQNEVEVNEAPANKKQKVVKKNGKAQNATVEAEVKEAPVKKVGKKQQEKKKIVAVEPEIKELPAKRATRKQPETKQAVEPKLKVLPAKKQKVSKNNSKPQNGNVEAEVKEVPIKAANKKQGKKNTVVEPEVKVVPVKKSKAEKPVKEKPIKKANTKKVVPEVQKSPEPIVKTKKLARTSVAIEKKKKPVNDKKLKTAAENLAKSKDTETTKVVKVTSLRKAKKAK